MRLSRVFSNTTVQKHQFFSAQLSLKSNSHIHTLGLVNGKIYEIAKGQDYNQDSREQKNKVEELSILDIKTGYKAGEVKTQLRHKIRPTD